MTLKRDSECPHCDGREVWHIERMEEHGQRTQPETFAVLHEQADFFAGREARIHGYFETYICRACGFTEWYAKNFGSLKPDPDNGVHLIVGDPSITPYR